MNQNGFIIHGLFQDDIDYAKLIKIQSEQGETRIPLSKNKGKSIQKVKTKTIRNRR